MVHDRSLRIIHLSASIVLACDLHPQGHIQGGSIMSVKEEERRG